MKHVVTKRKMNLKGNGIQTFLMLLPMLILFFMFSFYPLIEAIYLSFTKYNGFTIPKFTGLANFTRMFGDEVWWGVVGNTFQFSALCYLVQIPVALFLAIVLNSKLKFTNFFRTVVFLPNITSTAIMGIIFYFMFSSYNGIINGVLINTGLIQQPIEWLGNTFTAKLVIVSLTSWNQIGYLMILFLAGIQRIPGELYESAVIDGASKWKQFRYVTFPMLGSMFQVVSMMCILNGFQLFDSVKVLTNGGPGRNTSVMALYIYEYFFNSTGAQQGYASALSVCATVISATTGAIFMMLTQKKKKSVK